MKDKDISLDEITDVVDKNLIPSGSRIYDTSKSEKGRQIYPKRSSSPPIKYPRDGRADDEVGDGYDNDGNGAD